MSDFWEVFPVIIIFPTMAIMLKWYFDFRTRRHLIEKGMVDEKVKYLFFTGANGHVSSSLKWGLVLTLVGLAVVVIQFLPGYVADETILGVILCAAGLGLLIYYFIARFNGGRTDSGPK